MRFQSPRRWVLAALTASVTAIGALLPPAACALPIDYDIVYVRAPRYGDTQNSLWPDTVRPLTPDPGATLMLLHPNGSEELLFPRPEHAGLVDAPIGTGSVADPNVSFDGGRVVFTYHHDRTAVNGQRGTGDASLSYDGADLYVIDLTTRVVQRLTWQEFTPNTGNGADFDCSRPYTNCPQVGVFNSGPAWLADGRIAFTSSRNNLVPPQAFNSGQRTLQLFVMDADGRNVDQIGYLNQAMALHPYQLQDGRIAFSSWEGQGLRDLRQFPLWVIRPDGSQWTSLSGFSERATVHHFMTQMRNGDIVVTRYYNLNNNGFGDLIRYPINPPGPDYLPIDGPGAGDYPLEHKGIVRLTPFTTEQDVPAPCPGQEDNPYGSATNPSCAPAQRRGKFTMPAAAPNDDLLVVYSPGPCNHNGVWSSEDQPYYDGGIYVIPSGQPISAPSALVLVKNDPNYNEQWPRPVVAYQRIHGLAAPAVLPSVRNAGNEHNLPAGTPFGLIGTSSLIWRDTHAGPGPSWLPPDPFNYTHEFLYDWTAQGTDAGHYTDDDIWAVRILTMEPLTDRSYPDNGLGFGTVGTERLRILGEIPVRKPGDPQVLHPDGVLRSDTSFLAQVPADTPITFQTLDRNGMVLNMAETWHQIRPGEARYDCGGCHAHSKDPLDFHTTAAGQTGFVPTDLTQTTPLIAHDTAGNPITVSVASKTVDVEYVRDVQPILQRRCVSCHAGASPAGQLDLNADGTPEWVPWQNWPGTYFRLVLDSDSRYGIPPPTGTTWFAPQLTRYMRGFQSRQSLLMWKVWGARLDGRTNAERSDDIDFSGTASHPAGVGVAAMPESEKLTIARWIDLGAPIELDPSRGFFEDDLRPTLALQPSRGDAAAAAQLTVLRVGTYDLESGIDPTSLVLTLDVPVGSTAAGTNLAQGLAPTNGGVAQITLPAALSLVGRQVRVHAAVRDRAGHLTAVDRVYGSATTGGATPTLTPTSTPLPPTASATRTATRTMTRTATRAATRAVTVAPTRTVTPAPVVVLNPITVPVVAGTAATFTGSGFTAGSRIIGFVGTSSGTQSVGPFTPRSVTPTQLVWDVPASLPLGQGFAIFAVVNTDQGFIGSQYQQALLYGSASLNRPTILGINGGSLHAPDGALPVVYVGTPIYPGAEVTLSGTGFNNAGVNFFTAVGNLGPLWPKAGATATQIKVDIPPTAPLGLGAFEVINNPYVGNVGSQTVFVPIGDPPTITSVSQTGSTITVVGTGFATGAAVNFFNTQPGGVVNLGGAGLVATVGSPTQLQFAVPAGAVPGSSYVQIVNPPFITFTSSGNDPDGGLVLQ